MRLATAAPHFGDIGDIKPAPWVKFGRTGALKSDVVEAGLSQFYMTCAMSRASETMAECYRAADQHSAEMAAE